MNAADTRSPASQQGASERPRSRPSGPSTPPAWPSALRAADEFYVLAHDYRTGRPLLHGTSLGLGMAGALLSELVLDDRVSLPGGVPTRVVADPGNEPLAAELFIHIAALEPAPLRDWLAYLAPRCVGSVGDRLVRQRLFVAERRPRRGRSGGVSIRPSNSTAAYWRSVRLARLVADPHPDPVLAASAGIPDVVVAGLVNATSLLGTLIDTGLPGADLAPAQRHLEQAVARLPPDLAAIVSAVQRGVGDAVLSART